MLCLSALALSILFITFSTSSHAAVNNSTKPASTVIASSSESPACAGYTIRNDAGQYASFMNNNPTIANGTLYNEWWYFQVESGNIQFFTTIGYANPQYLGNSYGIGYIFSGISINGVKNSTINTNCTNYYDFASQCSVSSKTLNTNIGGAASVVGINKDTIQVVGTDKNLGVSFNLTFTRNISPAPLHLVQLGPFSSDFMYHQAFMASATVVGTITVNGVTRLMNGLGYHDHQWGSPLVLNWQPWTAIYTKDFALVSVTSDFAMSGNAYMDFFVNGAWHQLGNPTVTIIKIATDTTWGFQYPSLLKLSAASDGYSVNLTLKKAGKYWMTDAGAYGVVTPIMKSCNFEADGCIQQNGKTIKSIDQMASIEWLYTIF